jgi:hypothetical protein
MLAAPLGPFIDSGYNYVYENRLSAAGAPIYIELSR